MPIFLACMLRVFATQNSYLHGYANITLFTENTKNISASITLDAGTRGLFLDRSFQPEGIQQAYIVYLWGPWYGWEPCIKKKLHCESLTSALGWSAPSPPPQFSPVPSRSVQQTRLWIDRSFDRLPAQRPNEPANINPPGKHSSGCFHQAGRCFVKTTPLYPPPPFLPPLFSLSVFLSLLSSFFSSFTLSRLSSSLLHSSHLLLFSFSHISLPPFLLPSFPPSIFP